VDLNIKINFNDLDEIRSNAINFYTTLDAGLMETSQFTTYVYLKAVILFLKKNNIDLFINENSLLKDTDTINNYTDL
jgi:hypothetical protein